MRSSSACLGLFAICFAYAVFLYGGVVPNEWDCSLLGIAVTALGYALFRSQRAFAPRLPAAIRWPLLLIPAYLAFQIVPLPLFVLKVLSPLRANSLLDLAAVTHVASAGAISVLPSGTMSHLLRVSAYVLAFLLAYELSWDFRTRPWTTIWPLVAIAAIDGVIGLAQHAYGAEVRGTYANRDHYAFMLATALPFAAVYPLAALSQARIRRGGMPIVAVGIGLVSLSSMLLGEFYALSRMGLIASLAALSLIVFLKPTSLGAPRWKKFALSAGIANLAIVAFLFLTPEGAFGRFASLTSSTGELGDRPELWRETVSLVTAYPIFGCGMGGYESAFLRFKVSGPLYTDDYAHNDYLQLLAELGVVGFAIMACLVVAVFMLAIRSSRNHCRSDVGWLALACTASIAAVLIHSTADFNLYIPANALAVSWVLGITASLHHHCRRPTVSAEVVTPFS